MTEQRAGLSAEELAQEQAEHLPDREAMSVMDPTLVGPGGAGGTLPPETDPRLLGPPIQDSGGMLGPPIQTS